MGESRTGNKESLHHYLDESADQALFGPSSLSDPLDGIVTTFHANERPLQGLAGLLDWRFQGAISSYLRAGALSGQTGECAYLPITQQGRTYHLILIGAGTSPTPGERQTLDTETVSLLRKNAQKLGIRRLGVSREDLGKVGKDFFSKQLKEVPLWIVL